MISTDTCSRAIKRLPWPLFLAGVFCCAQQTAAQDSPWNRSGQPPRVVTLYPPKGTPRDLKWFEKPVHSAARKSWIRITVKTVFGTEVIAGKYLELTHISEKVSRTGGVLALRGGVVLDVRYMGKHSKPASRAYKVRRFQGDWVSVQWEKVPRAKKRRGR